MFSNYIVQLAHSQRSHTNPYKYTYKNSTPMSIFENRGVSKFSRLTKKNIRSHKKSNPGYEVLLRLSNH